MVVSVRNLPRFPLTGIRQAPKSLGSVSPAWTVFKMSSAIVFGGGEKQEGGGGRCPEKELLNLSQSINTPLSDRTSTGSL